MLMPPSNAPAAQAPKRKKIETPMPSSASGGKPNFEINVAPMSGAASNAIGSSVDVGTAPTTTTGCALECATAL